jgi:hypothetical protein
MPCRCPGICNQVTCLGWVGLGLGCGKGVPGYVRPSWDSKTNILSYLLYISPTGELILPRVKQLGSIQICYNHVVWVYLRYIPT